MNIQRVPKWLVIASLVLATIWTLLMWALYGTLSITDQGVASLLAALGASPQIEGWALWAGHFAQDVGNVVVILVWSVGLAALFLLTWAARFIMKWWHTSASCPQRQTASSHVR